MKKIISRFFRDKKEDRPAHQNMYFTAVMIGGVVILAVIFFDSSLIIV